MRTIIPLLLPALVLANGAWMPTDPFTDPESGPHLEIVVLVP